MESAEVPRRIMLTILWTMLFAALLVPLCILLNLLTQFLVPNVVADMFSSISRMPLLLNLLYCACLPALVEEVIDAEIGRFVREQSSFSSMEESLTEALSFFREHKRAAYHVYNSVNRDIFDRYLMKNCESVSIGYVNSILANTPLSEDDLQAIIHFNAYVCYGAVTRWLESGMTYDIHEDFRRMFQLMIEPAMKQQGMMVKPLK